MTPDRKISEIVLEFGEPVIQELSADSSTEEFEAAFRFVVAAWNAVVVDGWNNSNTYEKKFLNTLVSIPFEYQQLAKELLQRKKSRYFSDSRAVGNYWILKKNGNLVFRAEPRLRPDTP